MYRLVACKNLQSLSKVPERLLKSSEACNTSLTRCYSSGSKKKSGHPILYTLGLTTITVGGVVGYAKFDPDFRLWLEENLPGSDKFIEVVTEEKGVSVTDVVVNKYENIRTEVEAIKSDTLNKIESLTGFKFDDSPPTADLSPVSSSSPTNPPPPAKHAAVGGNFASSPPPLHPSPPVEKSSVEIKPVSSSVTSSLPPKVTDKPSSPIAKPSSPPKPTPTPPSTVQVDLKSFGDLERGLKLWSTAALDAYRDGLNALSKYDNRVVTVIDESVERPNDRTAWSELSKLKTETETSVSKLELIASDALHSLQNLKSQVSDPKFAASPEQVQALRGRINETLEKVEHARKQFQVQKTRNNVTEKYAKRIEEEKRKHQEELAILFPTPESYEKDPALKNLNTLLLYQSNKIQYYQTELAKLERAYQQSLDSRGGDGVARVELEQEKRHLAEQFQKKALELQVLFERDMRTQLKRQAEAHSDHLAEIMKLKQNAVDSKVVREYEIMKLKQNAVDSKVVREYETKLFEEKAKYKEQIGAMIGRMKAFEEAFKKRAYSEEAVQHSQALWRASQALVLRVKSALTHQDVKPLREEVEAIKKSAAKSDTFVQTVCAAFPIEALTKGVYSEQALRERFLDVQDSAYRVALVPESGATLPVVFLSYLQSLFIIRGLSGISAEEVRDEPTAKLNNLNTYEILERARYFVDRSDLLQAVKYMNLLQGGSKAVSSQWVADALVYLETETAAKALLSHAASVTFVQ
uniref:MICOS complex subunit MIC60 n=1 Tax=Cacopsylla melanoneura TaxID=428564 RepID=A0A8D9AW78_9HEMI